MTAMTTMTPCSCSTACRALLPMTYTIADYIGRSFDLVSQQQPDPVRSDKHIPVSSGRLPARGGAALPAGQLSPGLCPNRSWQDGHS